METLRDEPAKASDEAYIQKTERQVIEFSKVYREIEDKLRQSELE